MRLAQFLVALLSLPLSVVAAAPVPTFTLHARVVAVGIRDPAGVRQVGTFHAGGPIPGNPAFLLQTRAGQMLDPERVLVASGYNYGAPLAPLADTRQAPGAVLSIETRGVTTLVVPAAFAASGEQVEAAGGAVKLYTAHSPAFLNHSRNPRAVTAALPAAASPRYISVNNAFGRPWLANSPYGAGGAGTSTVLDPDGRPLDNAPSRIAGGVFAGSETNRTQIPKRTASGWLAQTFGYRASNQLTAGALSHGALGTAFLGPAPDGSGFAVFAVVTADGAIAQVHVQDGVDGLAPAGTIAPHPDSAGSEAPRLVGTAFQWNPDRVLYVADSARNRLAVLHLGDDARHFTLRRIDHYTAREFDRPIDLAAALPEVANPRFASHTTLAGGSDLYVANAGDGSLLRINQSGQVLARAEIRVPGLSTLGAHRLRGIAVASDAQRIWVTVAGELPGFAGHEGALLEVSAFDASGPYRSEAAGAPAAPARRSGAHTLDGAAAFHKEFTPSEGLGPLFNARACATCHSEPSAGGMSARPEHFAVRVARADTTTGRIEALHDANSPVARRYALRDDRSQLDVPGGAHAAGIPRLANVTSLRMPLALYSAGVLDRIPDAAILAHAVGKGDGIRGRPNRVPDASGKLSIGRYGWKADKANLDEMVASALATEIGITSPLAPATTQSSEDDGSLVRALADYLRSLQAPRRAERR